MKKSMTVTLTLISTLMILCAACSSSEAADVSDSMSPDDREEIVTVTPPPVKDNEAPTVTAEPVATPYTANEQNGGENEDVPEDLITAQNMIGQNVSELYAAIGEPESSAYTESCLVEDGNDGLLYYDGFIVSTVRYADGAEIVLGAY